MFYNIKVFRTDFSIILILAKSQNIKQSDVRQQKPRKPLQDDKAFFMSCLKWSFKKPKPNQIIFQIYSQDKNIKY